MQNLDKKKDMKIEGLLGKRKETVGEGKERLMGKRICLKYIICMHKMSKLNPLFCTFHIH
jgi:hypothetical protein